MLALKGKDLKQLEVMPQIKRQESTALQVKISPILDVKESIGIPMHGLNLKHLVPLKVTLLPEP